MKVIRTNTGKKTYNKQKHQTSAFKLLSMSYRDQFIWKRGIQLSINCYRLTEKFPKSELYGLTSQIRRASVSVPSNIADYMEYKNKTTITA